MCVSVLALLSCGGDGNVAELRNTIDEQNTGCQPEEVNEKVILERERSRSISIKQDLNNNSILKERFPAKAKHKL